MPETPSPPPKLPTEDQRSHKETPAHAKYAHSAPHDSPTTRTLESKRLALLQEAGDEIPEVPVDWFLDNIAPLVPEPWQSQLQVTVTQVKTLLVNSGKIKVLATVPDPLFDSEAQSPSPYFTDDPMKIQKADPSQNENTIFAKLPSLVDDIIEAIRAVATPDLMTERFALVHKPSHSPAGYDDYRARPDGCFMRLESTSQDAGKTSKAKSKLKLRLPEYAWIHVALPCEYKVNETDDDIKDNMQKILWHMGLILQTDPCRRFVYGITIENTQMRIWFACRSMVYVTESFDFLRENEKLIHFVLLFCFAKEAQVGWDPTIERIFISGSPGDITTPQPQYRLAVQDNITSQKVTVQTIEVMSDFGADAIRGRGTRVWKGLMKLNGIDQVVVIKDVWVDADRPREAEVLERLKEQASGDNADTALIARHFITILYSGDVLIDGETDHTLNLIQRGHSVPPSAGKFRINISKTTRSGKLSHHSIGAIPSTHPHFARQTKFTYQSKVHYRLVLKQVGQPMYSVPTLPEIFSHLRDATIALELATKYRWVHRDISPGNVLVCDGVGILNDLEYMKSLDQDTSSHDVRTGTINFIACEVASQGYLYNRKATKAQIPIFRHNPLHDLESLWWIALWEIMYHTLPLDDTDKSSQKDDNTTCEIDPNDQRTAQAIAYKDAFPRDIAGSIVREALIRTQSRLEIVTESCFPESSRLAALVVILGEMRASLFAAYEDAEREFPTTNEIDETAYQNRDIHKKFTEFFQKLTVTAPETKLIPLYSALSVSGKRPSAEPTGHGPTRNVRSKISEK